MKKRELFDSFEQMEKSSQQMQRTIASVKEEMERIVEQNAELAIENSHLRARLQELEEKTTGKRARRRKTVCPNRDKILKNFMKKVFTSATWTTCTDRDASMMNHAFFAKT